MPTAARAAATSPASFVSFAAEDAHFRGAERRFCTAADACGERVLAPTASNGDGNRSFTVLNKPNLYAVI